MKKLYTLLLTALVCSVAMAEVTFDASQFGLGNAAALTTQTIDGVSLSFDLGTNTNNQAPMYYTADGCRIYASNTFTVSCTTKKITKIVINYSADNRVISVAESGIASGYALNGTTGTWTGEANEVTFTKGGSGQARFNTLVVTLEGESTVDPEPEPEPEPEPDPEGNGVATIAALNALADNTEFTFTGEAVVLGQTADKQRLYIVDANNAAGNYIYSKTGVGQDYAFGDVIPAGWSGTKTTYPTNGGAPEIINPAGFAASEKAVKEFTPMEATIADVKVENFGRYAVIKGATIDDGKIVVGEESVDLYDRFGVTAPTDGKAYDIYGIISYFKDNQFFPIEFKSAEGEEPVVEPEGVKLTSLEDIYYLEDNTEFTFVGEEPVYVNYQNGKYLYLLQDVEEAAEDEEEEADIYTYAALIYQDLGTEYELGDILPAGWKGKKTSYKGLVEVTNVTDLAESTEQIDDIDYNTAAFDYNYYMSLLIDDPFGCQNYKFRLDDAIIEDVDEKGNFVVRQLSYYTDEDGNWVEDEDGYGLQKEVEIVCFNKFGIEIPENLKAEYVITGMASVFNGEFQFYPIEIARQGIELENLSYMDEGDYMYVSDVLQVAKVDEANKVIYATDNVYEERDFYGWFTWTVYPTWVALDFSDNEEGFEAAKNARALSNVGGYVVSPEVNPGLEVDLIPEAANEDAEDLIIFSYDLTDDYGLMYAVGNELAEIQNVTYDEVDGAPKAIGDTESGIPAIDVDFSLYTGTPWEKDWHYTTDAIVKLKEAWTEEEEESDEDYLAAPAHRSVKQGKKAVNPKALKRAQSKKVRSDRRARRVAATGDNYFENYIILPLEAIVTAVNTVEAHKQVAAVEYVNTLGQRSATAFEGVNVMITRYTDGTVKTVKVVK